MGYSSLQFHLQWLHFGSLKSGTGRGSIYPSEIKSENRSRLFPPRACCYSFISMLLPAGTREAGFSKSIFPEKRMPDSTRKSALWAVGGCSVFVTHVLTRYHHSKDFLAYYCRNRYSCLPLTGLFCIPVDFVVQARLELLDSSNPVVSVSWVAETFRAACIWFFMIELVWSSQFTPPLSCLSSLSWGTV